MKVISNASQLNSTKNMLQVGQAKGVGLNYKEQNSPKLIKEVNSSDVVNFKGASAIVDDVTDPFRSAARKVIRELHEEAGQKYKAPSEFFHKFTNSEKVSKTLKLVHTDEQLFKNIVTLGLAGALKPMFVLAMPGAKREDKEMTAARNAVGAAAGFGIGYIFMTPISKALEKVMKSENMAKYLGKDYAETLKNTVVADKNKAVLLDDTKLKSIYKTFYKNVADIACSPFKAAVTIALMPYFVKAFFSNKKGKDTEAIKQELAPILTSQFKLSEKEQVFKQFSGGAIK